MEYNVKDIVAVFDYGSEKVVMTKNLATGELVGDTDDSDSKYDATVTVTFKVPAGNPTIYVYANALARNGQTGPIGESEDTESAGTWTNWSTTLLSDATLGGFSNVTDVNEFWKTENSGEFFMSSTEPVVEQILEDSENNVTIEI